MKNRVVLPVVVAALAAVAPLAHANSGNGKGNGPHPKGGYQLGAAVESINPSAAQIAAGDFYLGGFGLSSG